MIYQRAFNNSIVICKTKQNTKSAGGAWKQAPFFAGKIPVWVKHGSKAISGQFAGIRKSPKTAVFRHSWGFIYLVAVGSAALTVHRTVIHYRLALRVMSGSRSINPGVSVAFCRFPLGFLFRIAVLYPLSPSQLFLLWVRIWVKRMAPGNSRITNTDSPNKEEIKKQNQFSSFLYSCGEGW